MVLDNLAFGLHCSFVNLTHTHTRFFQRASMRARMRVCMRVCIWVCVHTHVCG